MKIMKYSVLFFSLIFALFLAGCTSPNNASGQNTAKVTQGFCTYSDDNKLSCGDSWKVVLQGKEYDLQANQPMEIAKGKLIGLVRPVANPDQNNTFLIYTKPGTFAINEETSRKAVGYMVAGVS